MDKDQVIFQNNISLQAENQHWLEYLHWLGVKVEKAPSTGR